MSQATIVSPRTTELIMSRAASRSVDAAEGQLAIPTAEDLRAGKPEDLPVKRPQLPVRWAILSLLCCALIGSYYCYDIPTALNPTFQVYFNGTHNYQGKYALLYSLYSYPNTILPFFGGYLSDRLGVRLTAALFAGLVCIGQVIFAIGVTIHANGAASNLNTSWGVMWAGRIVFGFGGESLSVAMSAMIAQWFAGKELAFALGMNLALARIGSVINDWASLALANKYSPPVALWAGAVICVISLTATIVAFFIDRASARKLAQNRKTVAAASFGSGGGAVRTGSANRHPDPSDYSPNTVLRMDTQDLATDIDKDGVEEEKIDLLAVLKFPLVFWVLCISCVTIYAAVLPFNNIASGFIVTKYKLDGHPEDSIPKAELQKDFVEANDVMMVTFLTAGILSPFLGAVIDYVGHRATLNLVAGVLVVIVHSLLGYTRLPPTPVLAMLGLTYAIYASALWPCIALVIEPEFQGTAYGVVTAIQNLGLAVVPQIVAALQVHCEETYTCVETFFVVMGILGCIAGIALNVADAYAEKSVLNLSSAAILALEDAAEAGGSRAAAGDAEDPAAALLANDQLGDVGDRTPVSAHWARASKGKGQRP